MKGSDYIIHHNKQKYNICCREFTTQLQEKYPQLKKYSIGQLKKMIREFNRGLGDYIIENRDGIELPNFIGQLFIGSCKQVKPVPEHIIENSSKPLKIRNVDSHFPFCFYMTRNYASRFAMGKFWWFEANRELKERISENFSKNWKNYIDMASTYPVSANYLNDLKRTRAKNFNRYNDFHYREFDL